MESSLLACPVCAAPLVAVGAALRCAAGHSFDRAREGHITLLPAGHGATRRRGDDREMVDARRRFFERGHYAPITASILSAVGDRVQPGDVVGDLGCGEGSHLAGVIDATGGVGVGVDLSKDAIRRAARKWPTLTWVVGDTVGARCLRDRLLHVALIAFAPRDDDALARVLADTGTLVIVIPRDGHLAEARARYGGLHIQPEKRTVLIERLTHFALEDAVEHSAALQLDGDDVADLLTMTPHRHHITADTRQAAREGGPMTVTACWEVLRFRRREAPTGA